MAVKVKSTVKCDECGKIKECDGDTDALRFLRGDGWIIGFPMTMDLCPECASKLPKFNLGSSDPA